jgi:hypothetical protein
MKRTQIYIGDAQDARLGRRAKAARKTKSELIRAAIDMYLGGRPDEAAPLARFQAAVERVAGSVRRLPEGRKYVDAVRRKDLRRQHQLGLKWTRSSLTRRS